MPKNELFTAWLKFFRVSNFFDDHFDQKNKKKIGRVRTILHPLSNRLYLGPSPTTLKNSIFSGKGSSYIKYTQCSVKLRSVKLRFSLVVHLSCAFFKTRSQLNSCVFFYSMVDFFWQFITMTMSIRNMSFQIPWDTSCLRHVV